MWPEFRLECNGRFQRQNSSNYDNSEEKKKHKADRYLVWSKMNVVKPVVCRPFSDFRLLPLSSLVRYVHAKMSYGCRRVVVLFVLHSVKWKKERRKIENGHQKAQTHILIQREWTINTNIQSGM